MSKPLRIAWIGDPDHGGGVAGFCRQLVTLLLDSGVDLTLFTRSPTEVCGETLPARDNLRVVSNPPEWDWDRWYSKSQLTAFLTSSWARRRAYRDSVNALVAEHRQQPFDVVVQFSQGELFEAKRHLPELPPFLLFPCVHAAGELRWHREESELARVSESAFKHAVVRANLRYRSRLQGRCYRAVDGVIGMSRRFNELVAGDYGVDPKNQAVVYQPIDEPEAPTAVDDSSSNGKARLLYVGRIAVRKGVEMLVDLSKRLDDLAGTTELDIVGGPSTWSDYRGLLNDLNPNIATAHGGRKHDEVKKLMRSADVFVIPSQYEPGGIVVAEALSHGCKIVASDEVGSAEPLPREVCRRFRRGDADAFESAVREAIDETRSRRVEASQQAVSAARACYSVDATGARLIAILEQAAARRPISEAAGQGGED